MMYSKKQHTTHTGSTSHYVEIPRFDASLSRNLRKLTHNGMNNLRIIARAQDVLTGGRR